MQFVSNYWRENGNEQQAYKLRVDSLASSILQLLKYFEHQLIWLIGNEKAAVPNMRPRFL